MRRTVREKRLLFGLMGFGLVLTIALFVAWGWWRGGSESNQYIRQWLTEPEIRPQWNSAGGVACPGAPFVLPSAGFIGLLWADPARPYNPLRRHTGIDIFGDGMPGTVPNVAAYDGYLTRLDDWLSTVIIRHDDPLQPGRTIWTYYTHMANRAGTISYVVDDFPPGTSGQFVEQGTLLGYQGEYAGSGAAVAMHLHFSIVTSNDDGSFRNESILDNTLDPSPYLGLTVDINAQPPRPIRCTSPG